MLTIQDLGNTNTAIIVPRLHFTRALGAELVSKAIRERLGISQCGVNDRNDVIIRDGERNLKVRVPIKTFLATREQH